MTDTEQYIPLEPGAFAYIFADVRNSKPILDQLNSPLLTDRQVVKMVNRTHSAIIAVTPQESPQEGDQQVMPHIQLAAQGNYPAFGARMALGSNRNFKKQRSPQSGSVYWYSAMSMLSIALNSREIFAITSIGESPVDPFPGNQRTEMPEGLPEFRRGAVLSCWLVDPGNFLNQKLREMAIPIQIPAEQIYISLFSMNEPPASGSEQQYTIHIKIQVAGATQARSLSALFNIGRGFIPQGSGSVTESPDAASILAAMLFSNPPEQDGRNLIIKTNAYSGSELALLFNLFSL
ncbi:MAG: hypothetical protein FWG89_04440 [Treponema sp.]|nr:hypothetical protein [Treponema sp.]